MGRSMASEDRSRGHPGGAIRRRRCTGFPGQDGSRTVLERAERAHEEVRPGTAPGENTAAGVWTLCGGTTTEAWRREAGNLQLPGTHTYICGKTRNGRFTVIRQTIRKRMLAK